MGPSGHAIHRINLTRRPPRQTRRIQLANITTAIIATDVPTATSTSSRRSGTADVVVIGAGVGGLSCAALLAKAGLSVVVCESHNIPGGAAHAWVRDGYHFESGPSLYR